MDLTKFNLVSELMKQMTAGPPYHELGLGSYVVRTRISSHREMILCSDACKILKELLEEEYPDWFVQVEGYLGSDYEVAVCLSR